MATDQVFDVYADSTLTKVTVIKTGASGPANTTKVGSFTYPVGDDGFPSPVGNPAPIWASIRDVLYTAKQLNMQAVSISLVDAETVVHVTGISLNLTAPSIEVGKTVDLETTVTPSNASDTSISWKSSDETVATVSNGTVTGVKAGTATITVTTTDGGFTATSNVTVTAAT